MAEPTKSTGMSREVKAGLMASGAFGALLAGVVAKKYLAPDELLGHKPSTQQASYEFPDKPESENKEIEGPHPAAAEKAGPEADPVAKALASAKGSDVMLASAQDKAGQADKDKGMVSPLTGPAGGLPPLPSLPAAPVPSEPPAPSPVPGSAGVPSGGLPPLPSLPAASTPPAPSAPSQGGLPPLPSLPSAGTPPAPSAPSPGGLPPLPSLPAGGTPPAPPPPGAGVLPPLPALPAGGASAPPPPAPASINPRGPGEPAGLPPLPSLPAANGSGSPPLPAPASVSGLPMAPMSGSGLPPLSPLPPTAGSGLPSSVPGEAKVTAFPVGQGPAKRTEFFPAPESGAPGVPAPLPSAPLPANGPAGAPASPPAPTGLPPSGFPASPANGSAGLSRPLIVPAPISPEIVNRPIPVLTMPGSPSAPVDKPPVAATPLTGNASFPPIASAAGNLMPAGAREPIAPSAGLISPSGVARVPAATSGPPVVPAPIPAKPRVSSWSESVHVAKAGDTYGALAAQYYRDGTLGNALMNYNRLHPRAREDAPRDGSLVPGMEVYLPDRAALNAGTAGVVAPPGLKP